MKKLKEGADKTFCKGTSNEDNVMYGKKKKRKRKSLKDING